MEWMQASAYCRQAQAASSGLRENLAFCRHADSARHMRADGRASPPKSVLIGKPAWNRGMAHAWFHSRVAMANGLE